MKRIILLALSILLVPSALVATPSDEAPPAVPAGASAAPAVCATSLQARVWMAPELRALADCTATCWDGTTVTCSGSDCTAADSTCDPYRRGSCSSDIEGEKLCPDHICPCPAPSCGELAGSFCKGGSATCYHGSPPNCEALTCDCVDGTYHC